MVDLPVGSRVRRVMVFAGVPLGWRDRSEIRYDRIKLGRSSQLTTHSRARDEPARAVEENRGAKERTRILSEP